MIDQVEREQTGRVSSAKYGQKTNPIDCESPSTKTGLEVVCREKEFGKLLAEDRRSVTS